MYYGWKVNPAVSMGRRATKDFFFLFYERTKRHKKEKMIHPSVGIEFLGQNIISFQMFFFSFLMVPFSSSFISLLTDQTTTRSSSVPTRSSRVKIYPGDFVIIFYFSDVYFSSSFFWVYFILLLQIKPFEQYEPYEQGRNRKRNRNENRDKNNWNRKKILHVHVFVRWNQIRVGYQ